MHHAHGVRPRCEKIRIVVLDRRADDNARAAGTNRTAILRHQHDTRPLQLTQNGNRLPLVEKPIASRHPEIQIQEKLGQRAHPNTGNADNMDMRTGGQVQRIGCRVQGWDSGFGFRVLAHTLRKRGKRATAPRERPQPYAVRIISPASSS